MAPSTHGHAHPSHLHNLPLAAAADGKPDAAILASSGGCEDPREFYCTTYRSRHGAGTSALSPRDNALNTQFRWPRDVRTPHAGSEATSASELAAHAAAHSPRSGFARGVAPAFEYDPAVDECESQFSGLRANNIEPTTRAHFKHPPTAKNTPPTSPTTHGAATRDEIRLATSPYPSVRAVPGVFLSTMKASYVSPPPLLVKNARGPPTSPSSPRGDSAWTHDIEHRILGCAERLQSPSEFPPPISPSHKVTSPVSHIDTGYSRIARASSPLSQPTTPNHSQNILQEDLMTKEAHKPSPQRASPSSAKGSAWVAENTPRELLLAAMTRRSYDTSYSVAYDGTRQPRDLQLPHSPQSPQSAYSQQLPKSPQSPQTPNSHLSLSRSMVAPSRRALGLQIDTGRLHREGEYRASPVVAPASRSGYSLCNKFEFEPIDASSPLAPGNEAPTDVRMLQLRRERANKSLSTRI